MPDTAVNGHGLGRAHQGIQWVESSPIDHGEADLSLLLLLSNCSIKGLARGGALMQGKARGIRNGQGRIGGLDGQGLPHLHWLSLQTNPCCAIFSLGSVHAVSTLL